MQALSLLETSRLGAGKRPSEQMITESEEKGAINNLSQSVGNLTFSGNKNEAGEQVTNHPPQIVLPSEEVSGTLSDTDFTGDLDGGRVINKNGEGREQRDSARIAQLSEIRQLLAENGSSTDLYFGGAVANNL